MLILLSMMLSFLRINCLVDIFLYLMVVHAYLGLCMDFFHACGLSNVCGAIDGYHIPQNQKTFNS
jgi:hypothetical protein